MSDIAINVERLGKKFHIGGLQKSYYRLTDQLADMVMAPFRRAGNLIRQALAAFLFGNTHPSSSLQRVRPLLYCLRSSSQGRAPGVRRRGSEVQSGRTIIRGFGVRSAAMETEWRVARARLRDLLREKTQASHRELAEQLGYSIAWVRKWRKRLGQAPPDDE